MDKLGASIDSSLSAATLQISEGSVCLMEIFLGFWQVFYYFAFIFLLLFFFYSPSTEKAKSMTISWCQCSVEYVYSFLSWKFLLCGEEQNNSHQQQSKLKGISNWNNYIILPLTSRLVYPTSLSYPVMQEEGRKHTTCFHNPPGPHLTDVLSNSAWKQCNQVMFLIM